MTFLLDLWMYLNNISNCWMLFVYTYKLTTGTTINFSTANLYSPCPTLPSASDDKCNNYIEYITLLITITLILSSLVQKCFQSLCRVCSQYQLNLIWRLFWIWFLFFLSVQCFISWNAIPDREEKWLHYFCEEQAISILLNQYGKVTEAT